MITLKNVINRQIVKYLYRKNLSVYIRDKDNHIISYINNCHGNKEYNELFNQTKSNIMNNYMSIKNLYNRQVYKSYNNHFHPDGYNSDNYIFYESNNIIYKYDVKTKRKKMILDIKTITIRPCNIISIKPSICHNYIAFILLINNQSIFYIKNIKQNVIVQFNININQLDERLYQLTDFEWIDTSIYNINSHLVSKFIILLSDKQFRNCCVTQLSIDTNVLSSYFFRSSCKVTNKPQIITQIDVNVNNNLETINDCKAIINKLVYEECESVHININKSKDKLLLLLHFQSKVSSYCRYIINSTNHNDSLDNLSNQPVGSNNNIDIKLIDIFNNSKMSTSNYIRYFLEHSKSKFYLLTSPICMNTLIPYGLSSQLSNDLCLFGIDIPIQESTSGVANLSDKLVLIWPRSIDYNDHFILDYDIMEERVVIYGRRYNNTSFVHIVDITSSSFTTIDITNQVADLISSDSFQIIPSINNNYKSKSVYFTISNPIVPELLVSLDLTTNRLTLEHSYLSYDINDNELRNNYIIINKYVNMSTSTSSHSDIPMTIVVNKVDMSDGVYIGSPKPCLTVGYGAYGVPLSTAYSVEISELIQRGWIVVFVHIRGGGERGYKWHDDGRKLNKWNSFNDYYDCAQYLLKNVSII